MCIKKEEENKKINWNVTITFTLIIGFIMIVSAIIFSGIILSAYLSFSNNETHVIKSFLIFNGVLITEGTGIVCLKLCKRKHCDEKN